MSPAASAAVWSPATLRATRARRKKGSKAARPPLVEIPSKFVKPVEEVMKALTPDGQREFKEELHRAVESKEPGAELAYTVAAWSLSMYLMTDPDSRDILERLPDIYKQSEDLTMEELCKRIGV